MRSTLFKAFTVLMVAVLLYASGVAPAAYNLIMEEGGALARRSTLNFIGAGVTCVDNAGRTECTVPGGAASGVAAGGAAYREDFVAAGSVTMTNAEHGFNSANLQVACYDTTPALPQYFEPASITIDAATFQIVATFAGNMTGYCVVQGGGAVGCATYTVLSTNAAFVAASTTADVSLFTLPQYGKIVGTTIKHNTIYSDGGGAMTDVTVSVGNAIAPFTQYASTSSIGEATPVADTTFYDASGFKSTTMAAAGGTVSAHFIATGANFGNGAVTSLVSGDVDIWVCSLRVQ